MPNRSLKYIVPVKMHRNVQTALLIKWMIYKRGGERTGSQYDSTDHNFAPVQSTGHKNIQK